MKQFISKRMVLYFSLLFLGISGFFFTVLLPYPEGFFAFVGVAALGGFGVSATILYSKKTNTQLVCPTGSDCDVVIKSRYSKFFGIPLEYLGMAYFAAIFIAYIILLAFPQLLPGVALLGLRLLTMGAFFFSLYLLFVQAFLLRQWCIWCLLAAMLSMIIFFISLISLESAVLFFSKD